MVNFPLTLSTTTKLPATMRSFSASQGWITTFRYSPSTIPMARARGASTSPPAASGMQMVSWPSVTSTGPQVISAQAWVRRSATAQEGIEKQPTQPQQDDYSGYSDDQQLSVCKDRPSIQAEQSHEPWGIEDCPAGQCQREGAKDQARSVQRKVRHRAPIGIRLLAAPIATACTTSRSRRPNGSRLSCGAQKMNDSISNMCAPPASGAC